MNHLDYCSSLHRALPSRRWVAAGLLAVLGLAPGSAWAEALKSAQVSRVFNDVRLVPENQAPRPAVVSDTITGKAAVQTGAASRTELTFSDKTLTRLGADSFFSFVNGTRDMNLGSGTMLLQVPKGAGGATIHTAGVTAGITGTTLLVEYDPKRYSKIIVLEGTVRVSLTGRLGESVLVHAGQILIVPAKAKTLPDPVGLDLKALYATSGLINGFAPLPSRTLIDREITQQTKKLGSGALVNSSLFIAGTGTQVQAGNLGFVAAAGTNITARQGPTSPVLLGNAPNTNNTKYGPLAAIPGNDADVYAINTTTTILTDPFITTNDVLGKGRIYRAATVDATGATTASPDGLPSVYLLGAATTTPFTPGSGASFDSYFGAVGDIAVFRFTSLALLGTPASISTAAGPTNLALIADASITDASQASDSTNTVISLNGLGELLLATRQGSITLNRGTSFENTDGSAPNLTLYAQGGALDLEAGTNLHVGGGINLHSDTAMTLDGVTQAVGNVAALAGGPIALGANADVVSTNGQLFLQSTGGGVNLDGTATAQAQLALSGSGDVTTGAGSRVTSNGGNVFLYSANGAVTSNGTVSAGGTVYLEGTTGVVQNGPVTGTGGLEFLSSANLTATSTATTTAGAVLQAYGTLTLTSAQLSADTLKLQTFGSNGVLLIGGSSSLTGSSQLNLFAGGSTGRIEFTGNTTLNSTVAAVLTAATIKIDNNVTVTIAGPTALLYANTLQFSGSSGDSSTTGTFGGQGAVLAGGYSNGPSTALATAHGSSAGSVRPVATSGAIKPVAAKPVAPTFDGRYELTALVARAAQRVQATPVRGATRQDAGAKSAKPRPALPLRAPDVMSRSTALR